MIDLTAAVYIRPLVGHDVVLKYFTPRMYAYEYQKQPASRQVQDVSQMNNLQDAEYGIKISYP